MLLLLSSIHTLFQIRLLKVYGIIFLEITNLNGDQYNQHKRDLKKKRFMGTKLKGFLSNCKYIFADSPQCFIHLSAGICSTTPHGSTVGFTANCHVLPSFRLSVLLKTDFFPNRYFLRACFAFDTACPMLKCN